MNEIVYLLDESACQTMFFNGIIDILNKSLSGYSIIITVDYKSLPVTQYKKIVILVCEEEEKNIGKLYSPYTDVLAVFRFYGIEWGYDNEYVFPIPIGYNCRSNGKLMIKMYPEKRISERKYDIFYSGQSFPWRKELEGRLKELRTQFNVFSQVNPAFRMGLDIDDYYKHLGDSKICVVPNGASVDMFRYSEACGSGCVVITTPKSDLWYYRNAPVFYLDDWGKLTKEFLDDVLNKDLDVVQNNTLKYYKEYLSEEAIANYIIKNIQNERGS
jgi:hypothetical protein